MVRKGLTISAAILVLLTMFVSPFHIYADEITDILSYKYWYMLGFDEISNSETITVPSHVTSVPSVRSSFVTTTNAGFSGFTCQPNNTSSSVNATYQCRLRGGGDVTYPNETLGESTPSFNMTESAYTMTINGKQPWITNSTAYPTITSYQRKYSLYRAPQSYADKIIIAFLIYGTYVHDGTVAYYSRDNEQYSLTNYYQYIIGGASNTAWTLYAYSLNPVSPQQSNGDDFITIRFAKLEGKTNLKIVPIYVGQYNVMPSDIRELLGYDTKEVENLKLLRGNVQQIQNYILNGNYASENSVSSNDTQNNELTSTVTQINNLEDGFIDNMNDSIDNIDFNSSLVSNNNLLSSMTWVKQQYDRMTSGNIIGAMIQYSLLFGLGLLIIGRFK